MLFLTIGTNPVEHYLVRFQDISKGFHILGTKVDVIEHLNIADLFAIRALDMVMIAQGTVEMIRSAENADAFYLSFVNEHI